jgi:hypothetical protein
MNPSDLQGDLLQSAPAAATPAPWAKFEAQYQSLCTTLVIALCGMILFSFGVIFYMYKQMTNLSTRVDAARVEASAMFTDFRMKDEVLLRNFVSSLQVYASTNRDFAPLLEKYRPALYRYFTVAPTLPVPPGSTPKSSTTPKSAPK